MTAATPVRVGQVNGAGDVDAMFLKVWSGEVLTAFEQQLAFKDRVMQRTISSGKSAAFPRLGRMTAAYHVPGAEILGNAVNQAEVVITIDDLLISDAFFANIDEAKNHFDVRSPISAEVGKALANQWDSHLAQVGALAARATNAVTGLPAGFRVFTDSTGAPASADYTNDGQDLASGLFLQAQRFDENDVPEEGRVAFVRPAQYYAMAQVTDIINKQWGGQGAYSDGKVLRVAGFDIVKSNRVPNTDLSAVTDVRAGTGNRYRANFTHLAAVCLQTSALGTVKLLDLATEMAYDIRRQGTLIVSKYAVGHGILRCEAAGTIEQTTAAGADV